MMNLTKFLTYMFISWTVGIGIFLMHDQDILIPAVIVSINAVAGVNITLGDLLAFFIGIFMIIATVDAVILDAGSRR